MKVPVVESKVAVPAVTVRDDADQLVAGPCDSVNAKLEEPAVVSIDREVGFVMTGTFPMYILLLIDANPSKVELIKELIVVNNELVVYMPDGTVYIFPLITKVLKGERML